MPGQMIWLDQGGAQIDGQRRQHIMLIERRADAAEAGAISRKAVEASGRLMMASTRRMDNCR